MGQEKINHSKEELKGSTSADNIGSSDKIVSPSAGNKPLIEPQKSVPDATHENVENIHPRKKYSLKRTNRIYGDLFVDTRRSPENHSCEPNKQVFFKTPIGRPTKRPRKMEKEEVSTEGTIKPLVESGQNIPKP